MEGQHSPVSREVFTSSIKGRTVSLPPKTQRPNPEELGGVWRSASKSLSNAFEDNVINGVFKLLDQIWLIKLEYIWWLYLPEREE